jgi:predicted DNA-binding protein (MmcQ/YjbR family)
MGPDLPRGLSDDPRYPAGVDREKVREWCLKRPGVSEKTPFGPDVLVYKVGGKMFAALSLGGPGARVSLKCDPRFAEHLRARFAGVTPGYHLNKRHWNSVQLDGGVPSGDVLEMLGHSYTLVVESLPGRLRDGLGEEPKEAVSPRGRRRAGP